MSCIPENCKLLVDRVHIHLCQQHILEYALTQMVVSVECYRCAHTYRYVLDGSLELVNRQAAACS